MPPRPYILAESTWAEVRELKIQTVVLPWGATEPHNYHLPYATDNYETEHVAAESARLAWERGSHVMVLPAVPFGVNTGQLDLSLALNMNPSTQFALISDLANALAGQGIKKLVIINGHGGNDFRQMIRELSPKIPLFISTINWYALAKPASFFDEPGDHAGELETSVMMHITPELVRSLGTAGTGAARRFKVAGLRDGLAWAPRQWTKVTDDTGTGNPAKASAEKGSRYLEAVCVQIAEFLGDLDASDLDDMYGEPEGTAPHR